MIVLLLLYLFQFKEVPVYCKKLLNIDDKVLSSIGFEYFDRKEELVVRLMTPTTFLIVNILQIHYFNNLWLKITDTDIINATISTAREIIDEHNVTTDTKTKEEFHAFLYRCIRNMDKIYCCVSVYLWRLAEIHIFKTVIIVVVIYCLHKVKLFFIL